MKKFILSVLILFLFINSNAQDRAQKIDELVSKYAEIGVFNGSVLVGENGNIFLKKATDMLTANKNYRTHRKQNSALLLLQNNLLQCS
jgi:hypothetical protein